MTEPATMAAPVGGRPTVSVVIPTYRRAHYVRECLTHLAALRVQPLEVLVVDASDDGATREVVAGSPGVRYLRNDLGPGTTPESRGIGVDAARGDVVAFVDDDAYVEPDWLEELLAAYADPGVVGVGGRIVNGRDGETVEGIDRIGRLLPDGRLMGYFAADPGRPIQVDHLLGANMSYRRTALLDVGGIHGGYPGPCVCEETDIALRQRARGRRLVFTPTAVVRHVSAPYSIKGDRFDHRWRFYARRNHLAMLLRVFGPTSPYPRRYVASLLFEHVRLLRWIGQSLLGRTQERGLRRRLRTPLLVGYTAIDFAALAAGGVAGLVRRRAERTRAATSPG